MGADNADHAGPWRLLFWERQLGLSGWASDIRVQHGPSDTLAIELADGPWACASHEFRNDGAFLDLTLVHVSSGRSASGTFDMQDGVWAPADGGGHMTVSEFHREYAAVNTSVAIWPADPFKNIRAPEGLDAKSADGEFFIDLTTNQWRMSDWICPPRIVHVPTGDVLLDLSTTYWDGRASFKTDGMAELRLRQYPAAAFALVVELDLAVERYRVLAGAEPGLANEGYIDELQRALGRPQKDLDELGVLLDVRSSQRGARAASPAPIEPPAAPAAVMPRPSAPQPSAPRPSAPPAAAPPPSRRPEPGPSATVQPKSVEVPPAPVTIARPAAPMPPMAPVMPLKLLTPAPRAAVPAVVAGIAAATAVDPEWPMAAAAVPVIKLPDVIGAIEAEITRQRLHSALHYELIILNVIRAASMGITKPGDTVSMLQTLAKRRNEIAGEPPAAGG